MNLISHNGVIKPKQEAMISLFDIEFTYGFGVYESIRVSKGTAKYLDMHADRLLQSAREIDLEHTLNATDVINYVNSLVAKIDEPAYNLKLLLIGGKTAEDANFYILPLAPVFPNRKLYKQGATAITVDYERYLPNAKTLNMLPSYLAYRQAKQQNAYDAILVNRDGEMLEGTRTNLFAMKGSELFTPPVDQVLEGVTRINIIKCAKENGFNVTEAKLPLNDIRSYESYFLSSTSTKIMPLKSINNISLEISPDLLRLIKVFGESN